MTYPPNGPQHGPQHGYPDEPAPSYAHPSTETQAIPRSAVPQPAPPQDSSLHGLLQGAPPEYAGPPPEYAGAPPAYAGAPPEYAGAPPEYAGAPPEYTGPPPEYTGLPPEYAGPPPGYPSPPRGHQPAGHAPRRAPVPRVMIAIWALAALSVAGVVLGLSIKEHHVNAWSSVHAWGAVAILGAVLTAAPAFGTATHLSPLRCWQLAVAGAATLAFFWILFVLPSVGSNTTLLATVGVVAGIAAASIAPGRPAPSDSDAPTW